MVNVKFVENKRLRFFFQKCEGFFLKTLNTENKKVGR